MKDLRPFPVLLTYSERKLFPGCPQTVPWGLLAPHEERALRNHDQSLEKLASRGGLGPSEMVCILRDTHWRTMMNGIHGVPVEKERQCIKELERLVLEFESAPV